MFTFLKRRRAELDARTKIGVALHCQIKEAFEKNELEASKRLLSFFTAGYVVGFVRIGFFTITGVSGEKPADKHIRHICNGVLPGKLWEDMTRKFEALKLARGMDDQQRKIRRGSRLTPAESIDLFENAVKIGLYDGSYPDAFRENWAHNLTNYLVGELDPESFFDSFQQ